MRVGIGAPAGTRDRLSAECAKWREAEAKMADFFLSRGYGEVKTPAIEYYDLFLRLGGGLPDESLFKSVERGGKTLVLRPETTAPIARLTFSRLRELPMPQRLFYLQTVYRSDSANAGHQSEILQAGAELLGASGIKADLEVIITALSAAAAANADDPYFGLGHAGIMSGLLDELNISPQQTEALYMLIRDENYPAIYDFLAPFAANPSAAALVRLPFLFGGEEVLAEARGLTRGVKSCAEALDYLDGLYAVIRRMGLADRIRLDLGAVLQVGYYTGIVFRGFIAGAGHPVLTGGRYDNLAGKFGSPLPAAGFALDLDALIERGETAPKKNASRLLFAEVEYYGELFDYAATLAPGSYEISPLDDLRESECLARKKGIPLLTVVSERTEDIRIGGRA